MIGRTSGCTDVKKFGTNKFGDSLFGKKRFCFLEEEGFVGGSSAFGNKGKVIFVAGCSGNINLGG